MARSHRTWFYAALLLTPLAVSLGYAAVLSRPVVEAVPAPALPCPRAEAEISAPTVPVPVAAPVIVDTDRGAAARGGAR